MTPEYLSFQMKQLGNVYFIKLLTLMFLIEFLLTSVISQAEINKMTAQNIAICIAPCIMWAKELSINEIIYAKKSIQVLYLMLNNF